MMLSQFYPPLILTYWLTSYHLHDFLEKRPYQYSVCIPCVSPRFNYPGDLYKSLSFPLCNIPSLNSSFSVPNISLGSLFWTLARHDCTPAQHANQPIHFLVSYLPASTPFYNAACPWRWQRQWLLNRWKDFHKRRDSNPKAGLILVICSSLKVRSHIWHPHKQLAYCCFVYLSFHVESTHFRGNILTIISDSNKILQACWVSSGSGIYEILPSSFH